MYTNREARVLDEIRAEIEARGLCDLSHAQVAALAGVGRTTVRAAVAKAEERGEMIVKRRTADGLTNVMRFVG